MINLKDLNKLINEGHIVGSHTINHPNLKKINNLKELSMGMSNDYECAINYGATFVRVGSKIFSKV